MEMVASGEPVVPTSTRVSFGGGPAPAPERGGRRRAWIPRAHMPRTHRLASAVDPTGPVRRPAAPPLVAVGPSAPCKMSARVLAFSLRLFPLSSPSCGGGVGCGNRPLPPSLEGAFVAVRLYPTGGDNADGAPAVREDRNHPPTGALPTFFIFVSHARKRWRGWGEASTSLEGEIRWRGVRATGSTGRGRGWRPPAQDGAGAAPVPRQSRDFPTAMADLQPHALFFSG